MMTKYTNQFIYIYLKSVIKHLEKNPSTTSNPVRSNKLILPPTFSETLVSSNELKEEDFYLMYLDTATDTNINQYTIGFLGMELDKSSNNDNDFNYVVLLGKKDNPNNSNSNILHFIHSVSGNDGFNTIEINEPVPIQDTDKKTFQTFSDFKKMIENNHNVGHLTENAIFDLIKRQNTYYENHKKMMNTQKILKIEIDENSLLSREELEERFKVPENKNDFYVQYIKDVNSLSRTGKYIEINDNKQGFKYVQMVGIVYLTFQDTTSTNKNLHFFYTGINTNNTEKYLTFSISTYYARDGKQYQLYSKFIESINNNIENNFIIENTPSIQNLLLKVNAYEAAYTKLNQIIQFENDVSYEEKQKLHNLMEQKLTDFIVRTTYEIKQLPLVPVPLIKKNKSTEFPPKPKRGTRSLSLPRSRSSNSKSRKNGKLFFSRSLSPRSHTTQKARKKERVRHYYDVDERNLTELLPKRNTRSKRVDAKSSTPPQKSDSKSQVNNNISSSKSQSQSKGMSPSQQFKADSKSHHIPSSKSQSKHYTLAQASEKKTSNTPPSADSKPPKYTPRSFKGEKGILVDTNNTAYTTYDHIFVNYFPMYINQVDYAKLDPNHLVNGIKFSTSYEYTDTGNTAKGYRIKTHSNLTFKIIDEKVYKDNRNLKHFIPETEPFDYNNGFYKSDADEKIVYFKYAYIYYPDGFKLNLFNTDTDFYTKPQRDKPGFYLLRYEKYKNPFDYTNSKHENRGEK